MSVIYQAPHYHMHDVADTLHFTYDTEQPRR